jgi:uncharacterized cupin superfamily protein
VHRHRKQEELYLVLQGELTIELENAALWLRALQAARVAPNVKRQLWNRQLEPCIFLAIGAAGRHERGDGEAFLSFADEQARSPRDVPLPGGA